MSSTHKQITLVISDGRDCVHINADLTLRHREQIDDTDISKDVDWWECEDVGGVYKAKHVHMHGAVLEWLAKRLYVKGADD